MDLQSDTYLQSDTFTDCATPPGKQNNPLIIGHNDLMGGWIYFLVRFDSLHPRKHNFNVPRKVST